MEVRENTTFGQALRSFVNALTEGVLETYTVYLQTSMHQSNRLRFAQTAYRLNRVPNEKRRREWRNVLREWQDECDWEVRHNGPEVMNIVGVINALRKNRKLIFRLADEMPRRMQEANKALHAHFPAVYHNKLLLKKLRMQLALA